LILSEMIETLLISLQKIFASGSPRQCSGDVSHIVLPLQSVVFPDSNGPNEKNGESKAPVNLSTLEVKTALSRVYRQLNKAVPDKLLD